MFFFATAMKFKAGHWYYFLTALVFIVLAIYMRLNPGNLQYLDPIYREVIFWVLLGWGAFRAMNGYFLYKRNKYSNEN